MSQAKLFCCETCFYVRYAFVSEDLGKCPDCKGQSWVRLKVKP